MSAPRGGHLGAHAPCLDLTEYLFVLGVMDLQGVARVAGVACGRRGGDGPKILPAKVGRHARGPNAGPSGSSPIKGPHLFALL